MNTNPEDHLSSNQPLFQSSPLDDLDPENVKDLIKISKMLVVTGNDTPEKLLSALVKEFGDEAKPYASALFEAASQKLKEAARTPKEIRDSIDQEKDLSGETIYNMACGYLALGVPDDNVLERVHEDLQQVWPDISLNEVWETFTRYGLVKFPELNGIAKTTLPAIVPAQAESSPEADAQDNEGPAQSTVPGTEQPLTSEAVFDMLMELCGIKLVEAEDTFGEAEGVPRKH